jgi:hypothetical protein
MMSRGLLRGTHARDIALDRMFDELLKIADDGRNDWYEREGVRCVDHEHISRSKLRIDARKWYLSKLAPKRYGDWLELQHVGNIELVKIFDERDKAGAALPDAAR